MSLWNLIRDWFVQYIWGGIASNGDYFENNIIGEFLLVQPNEYSDLYVGNSVSFYIPIYTFPYGDWGNGTTSNIETMYYISVGDWLSTTSTIIVLILLLIVFGYLIVNLFKMFSNIFSLKR